MPAPPCKQWDCVCIASRQICPFRRRSMGPFLSCHSPPPPPDRLFLIAACCCMRESLGGPPLFTLRGLVVGTALRRSDSGLARCCLADSLDLRKMGVISILSSSGNSRQISSATPEISDKKLLTMTTRLEEGVTYAAQSPARLGQS